MKHTLKLLLRNYKHPSEIVCVYFWIIFYFGLYCFLSTHKKILWTAAPEKKIPSVTNCSCLQSYSPSEASLGKNVPPKNHDCTCNWSFDSFLQASNIRHTLKMYGFDIMVAATSWLFMTFPLFYCYNRFSNTITSMFLSCYFQCYWIKRNHQIYQDFPSNIRVTVIIKDLPQIEKNSTNEIYCISCSSWTISISKNIRKGL